MKKILYILPMIVIVFMATNVFAAPADDFVITVTTTSPDFDFTIPVAVGSIYNYEVDCEDDGFTDAIARTGEYTCDYSSAGPHTIRIKGTFPRAYFGSSTDNDKLTSIKQWGTTSWTSMNSAFEGCSNLVIDDVVAPDLSGLTDMGSMFEDATSIGGGIGAWAWNTSTVTHMNRMFDGATSFNKDITSWNVANVTSMYAMFEGAIAFNQNIGSWTITNLTDVASMFKNATVFNGNVGLWGANFGSVMYVIEMFENAEAFNQPLDGWDVSGITNMQDMFYNAEMFDQDLNSWDVSNVTDMDHMFAMTDDFNGNIISWDTSGVVGTSIPGGMHGMFQNADEFDQDISGWDVSNVRNMTYMFAGASSFNRNIRDWETGSLTGNTSMYGMFDGAYSFDADISGWDVSGVTSFWAMFRGATAFDQDLSSWDVSNVTRMDSMFSGVKLSTTNYNALLNGWSAQSLQDDVTFDGGTSNYCSAKSARNSMIADYTWIITDGGETSGCPPILSEVTAVTTPTSDSTPNYTFNTDEGGTITYGGSCSSATTIATVGNNTITFDELAVGTYSDCTIAITDNELDTSSNLFVSTFTIENQAESLYRFWSAKNKSHFYTASESEKDYIIANYDEYTWKYEGIANDVFKTQVTNSTPIYRFWSSKHKGHFYTGSATEKDYIIASYDENIWKYEGVAYYAYPTEQSDTRPVYRFWSSKNKHHFYTASETEKDYVIANYDDYVWKYEGKAWYVVE